MTWLRSYNSGGNSLPNIVNVGPSGCVETTYSFDLENSHFVVLNQYYDGSSDIGTDGDVSDALFNWLESDLATTTKSHIFVFGHEPAYPQPDEYNGRLRHLGDSLDKYEQNRDRFWSLLSTANVDAYFCGHTHNYSSYYYNGVWQVDAGHCRGAGDTGAPSTFLIVNVDGDNISDVSIDVYRDIHDGTYDYNDINKDYALPVKLSHFTAHPDKDLIVLEWTTESEFKNLGFILERRQSSITDWSEIASYIRNSELMGQGSVSYCTEYRFIAAQFFNCVV